MALRTEPAYIKQIGYLHPAELDRNLLEAMVTSRGGIWRIGDLAITPTGVNQQVSIAAGRAMLVGTENSNQGAYFVYSDASETKTFATPSGSPRIDTLLLRVKDDQYGAISGSPAAYWDIVAGVPSGSPAARVDADFNSGGSFYVPGAWLRVVDVRINVGDTVIPSGQITHNLRYVRPPGGLLICTSATRPSDPQVGDRIYETDTGMELQYQGSTPGWIYQGNYRRVTTLASTTASVTFSAIPAALRTLAIYWQARGSDTSFLATDLNVRINGDASGNYAYQYTQGSGTTTAAAAALPADTKFKAGVIPTAISTAPNIWGNGKIEIQNWNAVHNNSLQASWNSATMDTGSNGWHLTGGGRYQPAGPYTSVTVYPSNGSFLAGTDFTLIGIA